MTLLQPLDLAVLALYALLVVALGLIAQRSQRGTSDFFLGGRQLAWPLVGASILATAFSAASLLGGPGEAYEQGLLWLQLQLGDLLAIAAVCILFIPFLRGLRLTTAYEYLERRFDPRVRLFATLLFQGQVLLRAGVLVYGPALALATLIGLDVRLAIVSVGIVATVYTLLGGITAVIWTDVLQLVIVLAGLLLSAGAILADLPGGLGQAVRVASETGHLRLVDSSQPLSSVRSLLGAVLGYGVLALSVAGTNQQPVQRYLSCRSVPDAQRAALLGWGVGFVVTSLTLGIGVLLYAYYQSPVATAPPVDSADQIFPFFIAERLPPGITGLLVAAIFAAAMSSLDSALNSLATASVVDVYGRFLRPKCLDAHYLRVARWLTGVWGLAAIAAALYVSGRGSLLAMAVRYMGYFAGPMLGLFLLGMLDRRSNATGASWGVAVSFLGIVLLASRPPWLDALPTLGIWSAAVGTGLTTFVGALVSRLRPPPAAGQIEGLTWASRAHSGEDARIA